LCVDQLPPASPRLICVTPSHQFPSGAVMSLPRRWNCCSTRASTKLDP
jgi:GntR family transcriptional regulator/MocR family aminotransferase